MKATLFISLSHGYARRHANDAQLAFGGVASTRRSSLSAVSAVKAIVFLLLFVVLIVGAYRGWWWYISRDARVRDNADAFVSMFRADGQCEIRRKLKGPETRIPCADAGRYIREALKVSSGGTVTIGVSAETSEASMDVLIASIRREGFKIVGILKVGFITEPDRPR